jgi:hypothetical protein
MRMVTPTLYHMTIYAPIRPCPLSLPARLPEQRPPISAESIKQVAKRTALAHPTVANQ